MFFYGSDLEDMCAKDALYASDKTCVQPKPVSLFSVLCSLFCLPRFSTVFCSKCIIVLHSFSNFEHSVFWFTQDAVKVKVKSDINAEVQPGRGAQSFLRKEVMSVKCCFSSLILSPTCPFWT